MIGSIDKVTYIGCHQPETLHQLLIGPVELEPLARILCESSKNDKRSDLTMDVTVLKLLPDSTRSFLQEKDVCKLSTRVKS